MELREIYSKQARADTLPAAIAGRWGALLRPSAPPACAGPYGALLDNLARSFNSLSLVFNRRIEYLYHRSGRDWRCKFQSV